MPDFRRPNVGLLQLVLTAVLMLLGVVLVVRAFSHIIEPPVVRYSITFSVNLGAAEDSTAVVVMFTRTWQQPDGRGVVVDGQNYGLDHEPDYVNFFTDRQFNGTLVSDVVPEFPPGTYYRSVIASTLTGERSSGYRVRVEVKRKEECS